MTFLIPDTFLPRRLPLLSPRRRALWLELLQPFTAVKNLYEGSAPALQELAGGRTTEVLPVLKNIFLEGLQTGTVQESIRQFVATRQAIRSMTVSNWDGSGKIDD